MWQSQSRFIEETEGGEKSLQNETEWMKEAKLLAFKQNRQSKHKLE
jgi:hypothetical protein